MHTKESICVTAAVILFVRVFANVNALEVSYDPRNVTDFFVGDKLNVTVSIQSDQELKITDGSVSLEAQPESIVGAELGSDSWNCKNKACNGSIEITGRFLGFGKIFVHYASSIRNG